MIALRSGNRGVADKAGIRRLIGKANIARDSRIWASAASSYAQALELDPNQHAIWVQLGHALKELGNVSGGEASYRRALSLAPDVADTNIQLGHALKLQGRVREAAERYLAALVIDHNSQNARDELRGLGFAYDSLERAVETGILPGHPFLQDKHAATWEGVADGLDRIGVVGGWLYRSRFFTQDGQISSAMTFVSESGR